MEYEQQLTLAMEVEQYFQAKVSGSAILAYHEILPWQQVRDIDVFVIETNAELVKRFFENRGYKCETYSNNYGSARGYLCTKSLMIDIHISVVNNLSDVKIKIADIVLCKLAMMMNDWGFESNDYEEQLRKSDEPHSEFGSWIKMKKILAKLRNKGEVDE